MELAVIGWWYSQGTFGREWAGTNPTDRGKLGTKGHTLVDGRRVPLSSIVTEANKYDMKLAFPTIGSIIVEGPKVEQHICMDERYDFPEIKKGERRKEEWICGSHSS